MSVNIYSHPACLGHTLHSSVFEERARRVETLTAMFNTQGIVVDNNIVPVTKAQLSQIHKPEYIDLVEAMSKLGPVRGRIASFTNNKTVQWYTRVSPGSFDAARYAAGAVCKAVEETRAGKCNRAFAVIRPPGHHAGPERGEGFCLFNNIAMGAVHAIEHGAGRVAIVDFDRHHGNGTQDIVNALGNENIMLVSSYQEGCKYDKNDRNGWVSDHVLTVPIAQHSSFDEVHKQYARIVIPALHEFKPDLILISAGFDMHESDPLTNIKLKSKDYYDLTGMLVRAANELCSGRIVSALEGGYDVQALAESVDYHLQALRDNTPYPGF